MELLLGGLYLGYKWAARWQQANEPSHPTEEETAHFLKIKKKKKSPLIFKKRKEEEEEESGGATRRKY